MGRQTKISVFVLIWLGPPVGEEKKGEKKRKKRKRSGRRPKRYVFVFESCVIWIPRILVWRLVAPCSRVLRRDHPNPRFLEVCG